MLTLNGLLPLEVELPALVEMAPELVQVRVQVQAQDRIWGWGWGWEWAALSILVARLHIDLESSCRLP